MDRGRSPRFSMSRETPLSVLAVFCNPKGTDALRLQAEQRILQRSLPSSAASLNIQPAATLDDLQQALLMQTFDVIHFSGHGCIDAPLIRLLRQVLKSQRPELEARPEVQQCVQPAISAIKQWLGREAPLEADGPALRLTLHPPASGQAANASVALEGAAASTSTPSRLGGGGDSGLEAPPPSAGPSRADLCLRLTQADFSRHRVGSLAFESQTGALEPPKPEVLARLLVGGLSRNGPIGGGGVVFLNACDTAIQANWLMQHGAPSVIYCPHAYLGRRGSRILPRLLRGARHQLRRGGGVRAGSAGCGAQVRYGDARLSTAPAAAGAASAGGARTARGARWAAVRPRWHTWRQSRRLCTWRGLAGGRSRAGGRSVRR